MDNYIGKTVVFNDTNEKGIIVSYEYNSDLNHYCFKIRKDDEIITCFDDKQFTIISVLEF